MLYPVFHTAVILLAAMRAEEPATFPARLCKRQFLVCFCATQADLIAALACLRMSHTAQTT